MILRPLTPLIAFYYDALMPPVVLTWSTAMYLIHVAASGRPQTAGQTSRFGMPKTAIRHRAKMGMERMARKWV